MTMTLRILLGCLLSVAVPTLAAAYTCRLSPAGDAIMVKTGNASAADLSCTVTCRFTTPQGPFVVNCTQTIPAGQADWYVCLRPTGGKSIGALEGGEEKCVKSGAAR